MPTTSEYGYFAFSESSVEVGACVRFDIVVHVGRHGLRLGGLLRIEFPWGCWTPPVMAEIKVHRYLQHVNADAEPAAADPRVELVPRVWNRGVLNPFVTLAVQGGDLGEGDTVVFHYGVDSPHLAETRCQTYPIASASFVVRLNPSGYEREEWFALDRQGDLAVRAGAPAKLGLIAPSIVAASEAFPVRAAITDRFRNRPSEAYQGTLEYGVFEGEDAAVEPHGSAEGDATGRAGAEGVVRLSASGKGLSPASDAVTPLAFDSTLDYLPLPRRAGSEVEPRCEVPAVWIRRLESVSGVSNPVRVVEGNPSHRLFWGDLHVHSTLSDGACPIEEVYRYARDVSQIDIVAAADHESAIRFSDRNDAPDKWRRTQEAANRFYEPGRLVTFGASEWTSNRYGHRNIYFPDAQTEDFLAELPYDYVYYEMEPTHFYEIALRQDALIIPHHTLVATDWRYYDPRERLVEIYSTWGRTEYPGNPGWDKPDNPRGGALTGLKAGYRFGLIAGSDGHDSAGGRCYPGGPARNLNHRSGLMAVAAPELTREAIYAALQARHTYATTGERIYLSFRVDGAFMGSEIERPAGKRIEVTAEVAGTAPLRRVEVVLNGGPAHVAEPQGEWADFRWHATVPPAGTASFLYLRVEQTDGNMAWSSPVWVAGSSGGTSDDDPS